MCDLASAAQIGFLDLLSVNRHNCHLLKRLWRYCLRKTTKWYHVKLWPNQKGANLYQLLGHLKVHEMNELLTTQPKNIDSFIALAAKNRMIKS